MTLIKNQITEDRWWWWGSVKRRKPSRRTICRDEQHVHVSGQAEECTLWYLLMRIAAALRHDLIYPGQDQCIYSVCARSLSLLSITDQGIVYSNEIIQSLSTSFLLFFERISKCYFIFYRLLDPFYRIPLEGTNTISPRPPVFHKQTSRILCWGRQDVSSIYFPFSTCPPLLFMSANRRRRLKLLSGWEQDLYGLWDLFIVR